jgi:hypothetical protein
MAYGLLRDLMLQASTQASQIPRWQREELGAAQAGESVGIHGPVHQLAVSAHCALPHGPGADAGVGWTVLLSIVTMTLVVKAIVVDVVLSCCCCCCSAQNKQNQDIQSMNAILRRQT